MTKINIDEVKEYMCNKKYTDSNCKKNVHEKIFICVVYYMIVLFNFVVECECPRRADLHCNFYDTQCLPGFSLRNTYIMYKGKQCDACRLCFPDSGTISLL